NGPSFVECKTYRYYNHHGVQTLGMKYRPDEEVEEWKALDAIERLEARIVQEQAMTKGDIEAVRVSLEEEVQEAVTFGESSPDPDPTELLDHVYSEPRSAGQ
ncbi:MAG: thiamine pyrophosphate-dependent enzyme, partial [Actinomycetota bacterium]|nr:thiamine pyrophosphate-dependent enzyme [Actinomycetota bacterium]